MNKHFCSIAGCALLAFASVSHAAGYFGAAFGKTDLDIPGFDDGSSIALSGGFKVNPNFALELSYVDLGDSEDDIDPVWTIEADGLNFAAVGIFPVNENVDIFGKAGIFMWDATLSEAGFGEIGSDDGSDISFGFGAAVNLSRQFGLVFEYQAFELDDEDISNISFGARFNF